MTLPTVWKRWSDWGEEKCGRIHFSLSLLNEMSIVRYIFYACAFWLLQAVPVIHIELDSQGLKWQSQLTLPFSVAHWIHFTSRISFHVWWPFRGLISTLVYDTSLTSTQILLFMCVHKFTSKPIFIQLFVHFIQQKFLHGPDFVLGTLTYFFHLDFCYQLQNFTNSFEVNSDNNELKLMNNLRITKMSYHSPQLS
jgi:hypothetical protein